MSKDTNDLEVKLITQKRESNEDFINLYLFINGVRFELVPHCRSKRESAYFYALLKKSKLIKVM